MTANLDRAEPQDASLPSRPWGCGCGCRLYSRRLFTGSLLGAGLAVTVSPAYVAPWAKRQGLVMRRIVDPEVVRQVCLYRSAHRVASPATEGFAEYLKGRLQK